MDIKIYIFIGLITLLNINVNARNIKKINSHFHREYDMHDEYLARKESLKISHADLKSAVTCEDEDCKNGGVCKADMSGTKFCKCRDGSNGDLCENVPACEDKKFDKCKEPNGTCVLGEKGVKCDCKDDKKFDTNKNECRDECNDDEPCDIGGMCEKQFCTCLKGTYGDKCEKVYDCLEGKYKNCNDERGSCAFDKKQKKANCTCEEEDKKLDTSAGYCRGVCKADENCKNGAKCVEDAEVKGILFCNCPKGTIGEDCGTIIDCQREDKFCGDGNDVECGYNAKKSQAECMCTDERKKFDDKEKLCRMQCDEDEPCDNGGTCEKQFCTCQKGTYGDKCENVYDCLEGKYKNCNDERGTCAFDKEQTNAICTCEEDKKLDTSSGYCRATCEDEDCKNGGTCTADASGMKFCKCRDGSNGALCENVPSCKANKFKKCKEPNGTCVLGDNPNEGKCECSGEKKFDHIRNECRGTCDKDEKCQNGAVCASDSKGTKFCRCKSGYSGDFCKIIISCRNPKFRNCNGENGTCVVDYMNGARCDCKGGKEFDDQINECRGTCDEDQKCQNGAVCTADSKGTKFCRCKSGSSGDFCKFITSCGNPKFRSCKGENGTCVVDDTDGARCDCKGGRKFDDQINECRDLCTKNPCQNGGTCLLSGNAFKCICKENFSGDKCESRAVTTSFILQLAILSLLIVIFIVNISSVVFRRRG